MEGVGDHCCVPDGHPPADLFSAVIGLMPSRGEASPLAVYIQDHCIRFRHSPPRGGLTEHSKKWFTLYLNSIILFPIRLWV